MDRRIQEAKGKIRIIRSLLLCHACTYMCVCNVMYSRFIDAAHVHPPGQIDLAVPFSRFPLTHSYDHRQRAEEGTQDISLSPFFGPHRHVALVSNAIKYETEYGGARQKSFPTLMSRGMCAISNRETPPSLRGSFTSTSNITLYTYYSIC